MIIINFIKIFKMDFIIDDNFIKSLKPFGIAALGLAAVVTIAFGFKKYIGDDEQQQQLEHRTQRNKSPAGIINEGNTCFVNSLLQALAPLRLFVQNLQEFTSNSRTNIHEQLLFQLKQSLKKINNEKDSVDVIQFLGAIGQVSQIINFQQQDAYELFSIIVDSFQRVYNQHKNFSLNRSSLSVASSNQLQQTFLNCSTSSHAQSQTQNSLLGYTKSSIICSGCNEQRNIKIHPFYNLSFQISSRKITTIQDAINHFQQKQRIQDWACTKCSIISHQKKLEKVKQQMKGKELQHKQFLQGACEKIKEFLNQVHDDLQINEMNQKLGGFVKKFQKQYLLLSQNQFSFRDRIFVEITPVLRDITKQCIISRFPKILVIHLKQLSINPMTGEPMLLKKHLKFPKNLQVKVRNGSKHYGLVSLIAHSGNQSYGHYFTFRKLSSETQKWFFISDTNSTQCKEQIIKYYMPYMLFYQLDQRQKQQ